MYPGFFDNRDDMNRFNRRNKMESFSAGVNSYGFQPNVNIKLFYIEIVV